MEENYKNDFSKWCRQWEDAVQKRIFETPDQGVKVSQQAVIPNLYGLPTSRPTAGPTETDSDCWQNVYRISNSFTPSADEVIQEEVAFDIKKYVQAIGNNPNPLRPSTVGKDQDVTNPVSMGMTYSVDDLGNLENLKLKLHDLLTKLNSMEGRSQPGSPKLESQIKELQVQIDELSDNLGRGVPSQLGD